MKNIVLFILSVFLVVVSSVSWKISSNQIMKSCNDCNLFLKQITNIWYVVGWVFYILATFSWIYLLSKYDYSKAYPIFVGACIVLSVVTGFIFFKENTGMLYKITGAALIICGAMLIAKA